MLRLLQQQQQQQRQQQEQQQQQITVVRKLLGNVFSKSISCNPIYVPCFWFILFIYLTVLIAYR